MAITVDVETTDTHEIRTLRYQNKQLAKQLGRAGQRIHQLRCQLAESREINGKIARGHVRGLEREAEESVQTIIDLRIANKDLSELTNWQAQVIRDLREKLNDK